MDPIQPDPSDPLAAGLLRAGFRLVQRRAGWWECLLLDGESSWLGRGETQEDAVRAAFRAMIPSPRVRALLLPLLGMVGGAEAPAEEGAEEIAEEAAAEAAAEAPGDEDAADGGADGAGDAAPPAPAKRRRSPDPAEVGAALARLEDLERRIDEAAPELSELSSRRIRLNLLGWIALARAEEAALPGLEEVSEAVRSIAQRLQGIARELWPGNVSALQIHQTPRGSSGLLRLAEGEEAPTSWSELAERVNAALAEDEAREDRDADGWADSSALEPPPFAPQALLQEIHGRIVKLTGPLADARPQPGLRLDRRADLRAELLDLARKLRWLRGATPDVRSWGRLVGRLRCIADRHERSFPELGRLLADGYRPAGTWAKALGQDPTARLRQRRRRELFRSRPGPETEIGVLRAWLLEAFDLLDNPEIAVLVEGAAEAVLALDASTLPTARFRKRLRRLQERMRTAGGPDPTLARRLEEEAAAASAAAAEEPAEPAREDPLQRLRERARAHTAGRRLLFVTNRKDPQLLSRLTEALAPEELDWCEGKPHKVQAAAERIRGGAYDLVIGATGFMGHSSEGILTSACGTGTEYVRAFKGRELACLRAIVRDLGG